MTLAVFVCISQSLSWIEQIIEIVYLRASFFFLNLLQKTTDAGSDRLKVSEVMEEGLHNIF